MVQRFLSYDLKVKGIVTLLDHVEIKRQLDATDDIYCRFYCMVNMFRTILCPSSGAREYYTDGRCLWYLVLWFSSCWYDVSGLQAAALLCNKYHLLHLVGVLLPHIPSFLYFYMVQSLFYQIRN